MTDPSNPTGKPVRALPQRPHLDHLKNEAKARLTELRKFDPTAKLASAQFAVARDYGFSSWRSLRASVSRANETKANVEFLYPVIPVRDTVVFPGTVMPLYVGRAKSKKAIEYALGDRQEVVVVSQKTAALNEPTEEDLYRIGTVAKVMKSMELPDGTLAILVFGVCRARLHRFNTNESFLSSAVELLDKPAAEPEELQSILDRISTMAKPDGRLRHELLAKDLTSPSVDLQVKKQQYVLEDNDATVADRIRRRAEC